MPPPPLSRRTHPLVTFGRWLNRARLVLVNLVFFFFLGIFVLLLAAAFAGREANEIRADSVLVVAPQGALVEQYSVDPLSRALAGLSGEQPKQVQLRDLVEAIDRAAGDRRISRILLLPDDLASGGFASLREVGAALERFRAAGKPVLAWSTNLDQRQYYLAAHADRLLLDPMGGVMITGLANYRLFYKDLLDKLGVDVHLFRVGEFKSAAEPYILDHASPEAKEADAYWMGGVWSTWIDEVAALRKLEPAALRASVDELPARIGAVHGDLARLALDEHLVDGLATREELVALLRGQGVPEGRKDEDFRQVSLARYVADRAPDLGAKPGVAIVVAEGEIGGGTRAPGAIGGASTAKLIRGVRQDPANKALVLRVNSPGGEVYASEQIRREVELTRQAGIPVVVSMGDVAASGGYWISMNAERIYAEPNTITGSIGIFGLLYTLPNTLQRFGIASDGVGTSPLAGAFDVTRPLDPAVGTVIQAVIDKGYHDFVGRVATARGKDFAAIDAIAQGRVWSGVQARERGLVDALGGLDAAVHEAAKLAKLDADAPVRYVETPLSGFERFLANLNRNAAVAGLRSWGIRLPPGFAQLVARAPELPLLGSARTGKPAVYAHCLCGTE